MKEGPSPGSNHLCSEEDDVKQHYGPEAQLQGPSRFEDLPSSETQVETEEWCAI